MKEYLNYLKENSFELRKETETLQEFQQRYLSFLRKQDMKDGLIISDYKRDADDYGAVYSEGWVSTDGRHTGTKAK